MADERLKVEMLRFVDVFPTLRSRAGDRPPPARVLRAQGVAAPAALRWGISLTGQHSPVAPLASAVIRQPDEGVRAALHRRPGRARRRPGAPALRDARHRLHPRRARRGLGQRRRGPGLPAPLPRPARRPAAEAASWPADPRHRRRRLGALPRVNLSLKITSLYSQIDPVDFDGGVAAVKDRLRPIFRKAIETGAALTLDLEQFRYRDLTLGVFKSLLDEEEFRGYPDAGVVLQAYLRDADRDLERLLAWARDRGRPFNLRLVKGAYWDYETVIAAQEGWPVPVFTHKPDTDASTRSSRGAMLAGPDDVRPAFASHNVRSLAVAIEAARELGLADGRLRDPDAARHGRAHQGGRRRHGPAPARVRARGRAHPRHGLPGAAAAREHGQRVVPAPDVRRGGGGRRARPAARDLAGLRRRAHAAAASSRRPTRRPRARSATSRTPTSRAARTARRTTRRWPPSARGSARTTRCASTARHRDRRARSPRSTRRRRTRCSARSPRRPRRGRAAVAAAAPPLPAGGTPRRPSAPPSSSAPRSSCAPRPGALRAHDARGGKTWREADADVGEAIDFLEYYGREMLRLGTPRRLSDVPGENDLYFYEPRGVAVVIAPWNFPLAILTGMSAALVAGNTVVFKPANPTPVIAAHWCASCEAAGVPRRHRQLPARPRRGDRRLPGAPPPRRPDRLHRAWTWACASSARPPSTRPTTASRGSSPRWAARTPSSSTADADLDAAVGEAVISAFHYAGQKCSACRRVIVLERSTTSSCAASSRPPPASRVGDPADPAHARRPGHQRRGAGQDPGYIEQGKTRGDARLPPRAARGGWPGGGYFVAPHIFADVPPDAVIAQEEIFGPVLSVLGPPTSTRRWRSPTASVRPHRRPLLPQPGAIAAPTASSGSATSTSTAASPAPWWGGSRSAASG